VGLVHGLARLTGARPSSFRSGLAWAERLDLVLDQRHQAWDGGLGWAFSFCSAGFWPYFNTAVQRRLGLGDGLGVKDRRVERFGAGWSAHIADEVLQALAVTRQSGGLRGVHPVDALVSGLREELDALVIRSSASMFCCSFCSNSLPSCQRWMPYCCKMFCARSDSAIAS
jgi:hypothetical protein